MTVKKNGLVVELPYEIGTKLQTRENGKIQHDCVYCYIIGVGINVRLILCYDTNPRLSVPFPVEDLKKKWKPLEKSKEKKHEN